MSKEERCNTTLGLGIEVEVKREKQLKQKKRGFWLDLALPIHPKVELTDHGGYEHKHDEEKADQDSCSSKTIDDLEEKEERGEKRSDSSNFDVYHENSGGSRKKLKLTTEQITLLEDSFKIHSTLNTGQKQELAKKLHLLPRQIEVWFQNRRARTKLKQIEQECSLLKKCCETLSEENRRLKKELREARSLSKLDNHQQQPQLPPSFYIRYSTKTETRHPCDNIGKIGEDMKPVAAVNGSIVVHEQDNSNKKNATAKLL